MKLETHIKIHISGQDLTVPASDVTPETTLNAYLRERLYLTGTKRMCLEGGCGVCIVAVEEIDSEGKKIIFVVNSCLVSIFSCHGWKIHTIEGIGNPIIGFHPIQKLLADNNGSQCGFCSPGMVINMFALHESGPITKWQIENSFGGNICRCTGYRPILTAFKKLASDADPQEKLCLDIEDLNLCKKSENCKEKCKMARLKKDAHFFNAGKSKWIKVYYVNDLLQVLRTSGNSSYMLVAGNTARGVYYPTSTPDIYIDVTGVEELTTYTVTEDTVILGGNVTLTNCMQLFYRLAKENKGFSYLARMADHIDLVAHVPVRNIGTLAGNLMIKYEHNEFPSDIFLILETVNATLIIVDTEENEIMTSPQNFLRIDMNKKVIKQIILKAMDSSYHYLSYKIMIRAQNSHALVDAGFLFKLTETGVVQFATITYGAINAQFVHASKTEALLRDKYLFSNDVLQSAFRSLDQEVNPADSALPEGSPAFRKQLAIDLFYKYILNIAPKDKVSPRYRSGGTTLQRPVSVASQEFGTNKKEYPLTQPIVKVEALAQCSGQAEYTADIPDRPGQLHIAFVTADVIAGSTITSVNATKALQVQGVVAFYDKKDIPGKNTFTPLSTGSPIRVEEELFCSGVVRYYSQPVGIIVADTYETAVRATRLVNITYSQPKRRPYLNTRQVLQANDKSRIRHETGFIPRSRGSEIKHVIKGEMDIGQQYHYHMEVQACNAVPTDDGGVDLIPTTQWMDLAQTGAAAALNLPEQKINIRVRRLGGAYGAKISRNGLVSTACALAAYKLQKPIKMWVPFIQNMNIFGKRFPFLLQYEVGVNNKGAIQYLHANLYSDLGQGGNDPIDILVIDMFENAYNIDTWTFDTYSVFTDTYAGCYTRAPGSLEGTAGIETIMDHISATLNLDPMEVRMANFNNVKYPQILPMFKEIFQSADIANRRKDIKAFNEANRWMKRGISVVPMGWKLQVQSRFSVLVSIFHSNGGVGISHGGVEMGQGINTKVIQVCAWKFGIPIDKISVKPNYNLIAANNTTTGGSLTSEAVVYALLRSCDILLERIKPIRENNKNATWEQLIQLCYNANIHLTATTYYSESEPGIQQYPIYGVCATEVEVDILTGQQQILRVDLIEDVGDSMSPLIDIGQIEGAFVMGIGYYATEEMIFTSDGELLTNRTWTYKPPGAKDIPIDFRVRIPKNNPNPVGVLHSKAVAEPPMCLAISLPLAIRDAVGSARAEADRSQPIWYTISGPSTVENTLTNTLNNYRYFTL